MTTRTSSPSWFPVGAALLASSLATATVLAAPPSPPAAPGQPGSEPWAGPPLELRDGARPVLAQRAATKIRDAAGRELWPVRLAYPGRAVAVDAWIDETVIVQLSPERMPNAEAANAVLASSGASVVRSLMPSIGLWLVRAASGSDAIELAARLVAPNWRERGVRQAFPNLFVHRRAAAPYVPNDPSFAGQWYFDNLQMSEAWGLERGDASVSIVVVDTGCDLAHPDLDAKLDQGRDVADGDDDPSCDPTEEGAAHGTSCAGIVAAETDNAEGIAGACPECRLRCVRLLTETAEPLSADVEAFQFALDVDAAVVSNSWGYTTSIPAPQAVADAVNNLFVNGRGGKGALVIFAAGNDDRLIEDDELEAVEGVFAVGAITQFDEGTQYTNYGNCLDVVAYTGTLTTDISGSEGNDPGDYTSSFGGTSSACPVVAGISGLLASAGTEHTASELYQVMVDTAKPAPFAVPDDDGHDPVYGFGIIQPVEALEAVLGIVGGAGGTGAGGADAGAGGTPSAPPSDAQAEGGCHVSASRQSGGPGLWPGLALAAGVAWQQRRRTARAPR